MTQERVANALDWSLSKVIRIESGTVNISTTDLRALLQLYGVSEDRIKDLVTLARTAKERAWWSGYKRVLSQPYLDRIGYEAAASIIRQFEPLAIPGLLQTAEYARTYIKELIAPERAGDVDTLVEIRLRRQELLEANEAPLLFFILDEAVVLRQVGGPQVMRRQLQNLVNMTTHPNITIEVVPFSAGVHPGLRGAFTILEFPDPEDDDVLHLESPEGILVTRDLGEQVVTYRENFERLRQVSLGPEGSAVLLNRLAESL